MAKMRELDECVFGVKTVISSIRAKLKNVTSQEPDRQHQINPVKHLVIYFFSYLSINRPA